ncbi:MULTISPECIES: HAMP domain-containing sensor histidine kinase [unclassified Actinomyces]|nr:MULTISPECIES: HAMP domain-containing sensor histidine kinase [unclassified Actinomyces]MCL3777365.1 HAMP domain-containing histidine kinase [Actinomyces sp. AC-20-1]MCL3789334.1 HAMP domain-containing histidine kinase [Actinomyces sp. 187325]MCL3792526.1 HAMP domain-containing histidine kinase [Actinomyces sp. 186855]MCL3794001.1 HAMP domain-containing histidine kinase [Actinomyces sp. 217892]
MAALMGAFSTLSLRHTLMDRLDEQLVAASERAAARRHGLTVQAGLGDGGKDGQKGQRCATAGAGDAATGAVAGTVPDAVPSTVPSPVPGAVDTGEEADDDHHPPVPEGLDATGQSTGTLSVISPGAGKDGATGAATTVRAGYIDDDGTYQALSARETAALLSLEPTGEPVTVSIDSLGDYRVLVARDETTGDVVVTGLSMRGDNTLVRTQLVIELAIAVVGAVVAALVGRSMVRSATAPLERVATTAQRVASQPLASGEVSIDERVSEEDLASSQEVGQVGTALNTLLDHVDAALAARQRSETQVRQFVADASHELRTPLASIRGYTELIQREGADAALPEEALHALQRVRSESVRMTALVEDLLLLARLDAGRELRHEEVDLLALLLDTVSDARAAGPGQEWVLDLSALGDGDESEEEPEDPEDTGPPVVTGDEARLQQVVVNLLANARVHTPAGSRVVTRIRREPPGPGPTAAPAPGAPGRAGSWVISVSDDGPGIDPAVRERLFERFARADASRERRTGSTGLGMSIALAIVRSHGGTLTVDSVRQGDAPSAGAALRRGAVDGWAREHGTTFTVRLPAAG